jgi:hypothetical protein
MSDIDDRVGFAQPGSLLNYIFQDITEDLRENGSTTSTTTRSISLQGSLKDIAKKITVAEVPVKIS